MKLFSIQLASMFVVGLTGFSFAASAKDDFECYTDSLDGGQVCMVTPVDAPTSSNLKLRSEGSEISMLSEHELSGDAVEPVSLAGLDLDDDSADELGATTMSRSVGMEAASISQSVKTQEQLRWIETFLKTGPSAASPDIRTRVSAKPSK